MGSSIEDLKISVDWFLQYVVLPGPFTLQFSGSDGFVTNSVSIASVINSYQLYLKINAINGLMPLQNCCGVDNNVLNFATFSLLLLPSRLFLRHSFVTTIPCITHLLHYSIIQSPRVPYLCLDRSHILWHINSMCTMVHHHHLHPVSVFHHLELL